jgi:propanol-preferring alcohol dehydrogenase
MWPLTNSNVAMALGAEIVIDGSKQDPVEAIQREIGGGVHAALVTAVATKAFEQAILMLRLAGTVIFIGVPGGKGDEHCASLIYGAMC